MTQGFRSQVSGVRREATSVVSGQLSVVSGKEILRYAQNDTMAPGMIRERVTDGESGNGGD